MRSVSVSSPRPAASPGGAAALVGLALAALALGACEGIGIMGGLPHERGDGDADTDADPGACAGECEARLHTFCTCAPEDPCGYRANGTCDEAGCAAVRPSEPFDDTADCAGPGCDGSCARGWYDECTCAPGDPCGWVRDSYCDSRCEEVLPGAWFDDSADCAVTTTCDGDCDSRRYSPCSCGADDPCAWRSNGVCDEACATVSASRFDDSADCYVPPPDRTFGVTAVADDLDRNDMVIVARGLSGAGYAESVRDTNVSTSALARYLGQGLTALYHTGHGTEGLVMTSDGALGIGTTTITTRNVVFATCLTLQESWASAFGSSAETVLGYTMVSYDFIDDDAGRVFVDELARGRSYIAAWYLANNGISMLADRWAGYVREGGGVVEYSARSGRRPTVALPVGEWVELGRAPGLRMAAGLLRDERRFDEQAASFRVLGPAELASELDPDPFGRLGPEVVGEVEAVALAEAALASSAEGLPADAVLGDVLALVRRSGPLSPSAVVGRVVRFGRELGGLPVRGNLVSDHLAVLVGPDGVLAVSRYWPEVGSGETWTGGLLSAGEAALAAADPISRALKGGELDLVDAVPVHGTPGPAGPPGELVPAWELRGPGGASIVVSAMTGAPIF